MNKRVLPLICDRAYRRLPDLVDDENVLLRNALRELFREYLWGTKKLHHGDGVFEGGELFSIFRKQLVLILF